MGRESGNYAAEKECIPESAFAFQSAFWNCSLYYFAKTPNVTQRAKLKERRPENEPSIVPAGTDWRDLEPIQNAV